ncbi:MAG: Asp-tRNA(Asn)/Glu-tRNA(Gln) amidotransferase GatCAB subunit B, partial [Oscillospiraceae bacterium]|nr:Asp-tRNA(Asn)/Glu-tRNA(Gln) amidotransferase GatCAB subunit B [Oscillospiraceae bacterium]
ALVSLVTSKKINRNAYREVIEAVFTHDVKPEDYIAEKGLMMISDDSAVIEAVNAVLADNAEAVADYAAGKEKAFGFLMGQVMRKLGGAGNPEIVKTVLTERL